jgi:hypothetical protein
MPYVSKWGQQERERETSKTFHISDPEGGDENLTSL